MATGKRGVTRSTKSKGGQVTGKQQSTQAPSEGARAAERASAGIGTDDTSLWEDWFLDSPPEGSSSDENALLG
jgi:hypothetical protein